MTLRTDAAAAYAASQTARAAAARAALGAILTPAVVSGLTIAQKMSEDAFTIYVFTDGDLYFAVRSEAQFDPDGVRLEDKPWTVSLVVNSDGWTAVAEITTLAQLGESLPLSPPPAWMIGVRYVIGAVVTFGGLTWTARIEHTAVAGFEPPVKPAYWAKVVA